MIPSFWPEPEKRATRVARAQPPIPDTGWRPPSELPNLVNARVLGLDTETSDPNMKTHGPGWARGDGHIVGVSVAVAERAWYFPLRHEVQPELNMDADNVMRWLRDTLRPNVAIVGANLIYDLGWLSEYGIFPQGPLGDVQFAETLLTENTPVDLDTIAQRWLGAGKETPLLYQWLADAYGGQPNGDQRANMYRSPVTLAGPYAEADALLPLRAIDPMHREMRAQGVANVFAMENCLIPLLIAMRRAGVSVDIMRAHAVREKLLGSQQQLETVLREQCGFDVNVFAAESVAKAFDKFSLSYPVTEAGAPSFRKEWLERHEHPLGKLVSQIRGVDKLRSTFIESYVLGSHVNGKLFTSFHPLRGTEGGARSGRFASSKPNLQNIPSRDEVLAPLIRSVFVPDTGHEQWRRYDYSQIEYRMLAHFARGEGADAVRDVFRNDPSADYHQLIIDTIRAVTGFELARKPAKNVNFGLIYGMGKSKLVRQIGLTKEKGDELFAAYHAGAPFARTTMEHYSKQAEASGVVATIMGRLSRFEFWSPRWQEPDEDRLALPLNLALQKWPHVELVRAMTHKALNRVLQGSAADMMKAAMLKCWRDGLFNTTGVPRLTVHDELDFSDPGGCDEAFAEIRRTLETAIPLHVPVIADCDTGPDWGACT